MKFPLGYVWLCVWAAGSLALWLIAAESALWLIRQRRKNREVNRCR